MSAADDPVFHKARLTPASWIVLCPCCEAAVELGVEEDDAGVFHGIEEHQFPHCEHCGARIEATPVRLVEVVAPPFRADRLAVFAEAEKP